ncbi:MAG TPA: DUF1905 domain-containing protein [Mycobacteriales bacterium]|nr:DUF1905 domain-containing protein [Mycobacteriales bacterium]
MHLRFSAALWEYAGEGSWHFVTMPAEMSEDVRAVPRPRRGFGSVRVRATVGSTVWTTSVFPSKDGTYVLPVKRSVRNAEGLEVGEPVAVGLEVLD